MSLSFASRLASPTTRARTARAGFTLIEMLVVLVIIAILAGMIFSMMGLIGRNSEKAKTRRTLELLANAVEEFRAEYGKYPPVPEYDGVQPLAYEWCELDRPDRPTGLTDSLANLIAREKNDPGIVYIFGLISFLEPRYTDRAKNSPERLTKEYDTAEDRNAQWYSYNAHAEDRPRDLRAINRFRPYTDPIVDQHWVARSHKGTAYTNFYRSVHDAWERTLRYTSKPPYDSYRLWSVGPDGTDGTADDIVAGRENQ